MGKCGNHIEHLDRIGVKTAWTLLARLNPWRLANVSHGTSRVVYRLNHNRLPSVRASSGSPDFQDVCHFLRLTELPPDNDSGL
jgi:hypothetical protein